MRPLDRRGTTRQPRNPRQASAAPPAPYACPVCAAFGLAPSGPQGSAQLDRRHIPPLAVSHAIFSNAESPVPSQEPGAPQGSSPRRGYVTCVLQRVVRGTLVLRGCGVPQAVPRDDTFPILVMGGGSDPAIDRSPTPAITASWGLYEEEDAYLR